MQIITWRNYYHKYSQDNGHHVTGNLKVAQAIHSPQLKNEREIVVYLPPTYDKSHKHYPVLYMQDGQNLFDPKNSFAGEWGVDETMNYLANMNNLEGIVVGIPNAGVHRLAEYSPYADSHHGGGQGDIYLDFVVNTLKPLIDRDFRTLPQQKSTGIMGSSMGGLISLYAFFHNAETFGFCGVMSPSLWYGDNKIFDYIESVEHHPGKIYLDAGTRELGGAWPNHLIQLSKSRRYYGGVRRMKRLLVQKGYRPVHDLLHVEEKYAHHNEAAWARRLPTALRFFLNHAIR